MRHAVVVGAGVAGMLAARALAGVCDRVTVFERDDLPTDSGHRAVPGRVRRGAPQGRHAHLLLAGGLTAMEELLPGLTDELRREGAPQADVQRDLRWSGNGATVRRDPSGLHTLLVSRPLLETGMRRRLRALGGVEIKDRHETVGLMSAPGSHAVDGVLVRPAGGSGTRDVPADLVVDATGRASRGPVWLAQAGYAVPASERFPIALRYATFHFAPGPGPDGALGVLASLSGAASRGAVALAQEDGRWVITLQGRGADVPPTDPEGLRSFLTEMGVPEVGDSLTALRPSQAAVPSRYPEVVRHDYRSMPERPRGFLALGDALTSLDPAHGQGMTAAALQALLLRDRAREDGENVPSSFAEAAAELTGRLWEAGLSAYAPEGADERWRSAVRRRDQYLSLVYAAGAKDGEIANSLVRLANLLDPPGVLFRPETRQRVLALAGGPDRGDQRVTSAGRP
ncbi:hypothetical protein AB0941_39515 [Streptomyces sp. NPDC013433]|uniref:NAD(P)/FAD-dependent oxidoreductase n=1 Tax=Streptomyces sp. NPDC013433 TaxID=3155604 RepID=UPI0034521126